LIVGGKKQRDLIVCDLFHDGPLLNRGFNLTLLSVRILGSVKIGTSTEQLFSG